MTTRTDDADATAEHDAITAGRYADIGLEDGDVVIYDREAENAWVQSASAVDLDAVV
jgi:hypothetical protein